MTSPRRRFATINQKVSDFRSAAIVSPLKASAVPVRFGGFRRFPCCNRRTVTKRIGPIKIFSPTDGSDRAHFFYPDYFTIIVQLANNGVVRCDRASFFCAGGPRLFQPLRSAGGSHFFLISLLESWSNGLPQSHRDSKEDEDYLFLLLFCPSCLSVFCRFAASRSSDSSIVSGVARLFVRISSSS
jgi:hypothetical protein